MGKLHSCGMIIGWINHSKKGFPSCCHLLRVIPYMCMIGIGLRIKYSYFIHPYPLKHTTNSHKCKIWFSCNRMSMWKTLGLVTAKKANILPSQCIIIYANNSKNNIYINGCGRALVDWETKFSSGFYYMTEWTPGTCSKESISLWKVTPVYLPWRHGRNCETSIMGLWICSRLLPQYHSA